MGVAAVLVAIAAFVGYGWYRYNQINREDLDLASSSGGVQNFLIVGSDSRSVVDKGDPNASAFLNAKGADQAGQRSDTIMVARVDSNAKTIDLISFPRDLWVPIQPSGENERINTAYAQGKDPRDGAQRLINTIKADFNIDINHYIEINFKSFKGITDAVGGVPLYFDKPVRDRSSGFYQYDTGCQVLKGEQALAYARSRHLEYYDTKNKKWIEDPSADLGRISRQTLFMRTMLNRAQGKFGSLDMKAINSLISSTADNLSLDTNLGVGQLVSLARSFKGFSGDQIVTHALPVYPDTTAGGASILRLDAKAAEPIFTIFRGKGSIVSPGAVVMGVSVSKDAKFGSDAVAGSFNKLGYHASQVDDMKKSLDHSVVRYAPGYGPQADLVARQVAGGADLVEDSSLAKKPQPIVLQVGSDFTAALDKPVASPNDPTTTTTAAPPTTAAGAGKGTTTTTRPATTSSTVKPGEVTDFVGVLAGEAPPGQSCP